MTSQLTPEERQRIIEEQRIRNQETLKTGMKLWLKMALILGGIVIVMVICYLVFLVGMINSTLPSV